MTTHDVTRWTVCRVRAALLAAALLLAVAPHLHAQGAMFKLKNRSKFSGTLVARDPFWPIGWNKETRNEAQGGGEEEISPDEFVVTSILLSPPALAVINGKEYGEGQFVPVPGSMAKAQVAAIRDGTVFLFYHGKTIPTGLRRNEHLSAPKPESLFDTSSSPAEAAISPPR